MTVFLINRLYKSGALYAIILVSIVVDFSPGNRPAILSNVLTFVLLHNVTSR